MSEDVKTSDIDKMLAAEDAPVETTTVPTLSPEEIVAAAQAEAESPQKPQAQAGPMKEVPPGQRELLATVANSMMDNDKDLRNTVGAMIAARHLYVVGREELGHYFDQFDEAQQRELIKAALEKMGEAKPEEEYDPLETFGLAEEYLIQAAAHGGSLSFDGNDLVTGMHQTVLRWLIKAVARRNAEEKVERSKEWAASEKARRERPVPLGLKLDSNLEDKLPRDTRLVLAGWRPAVLWLLDQLTSNALKAKDDQLYSVLRLLTGVRKLDPTPEAYSRLYRLGVSNWQDCCKTNKTWPIIFQTQVLPQLSEPLDLMVVDDLSLAGQSSGLLGGHAARKAAFAQKRLYDWCRKVGCALLGGVLLDDKEPLQLTGPAWEELRLHTTLRPVWVQEVEDDKYRVYIGKNTVLDTVDRALLDKQSGSKIIIP